MWLLKLLHCILAAGDSYECSVGAVESNSKSFGAISTCTAPFTELGVSCDVCKGLKPKASAGEANGIRI
jgi:hypothetical protein